MLYFQTISPTGKTLSILGFYLFISLIFIFFQMLEFALVLVVEEMNDHKLHDTNHDKDILESGKITSREIKQIQNTVSKVSPFEGKNCDQNTSGVTKSRKATSWIIRPRFFGKLPLTRKIDFLALIIHHFAYFLFNAIYWNSV